MNLSSSSLACSLSSASCSASHSICSRLHTHLPTKSIHVSHAHTLSAAVKTPKGHWPKRRRAFSAVHRRAPKCLSPACDTNKPNNGGCRRPRSAKEIHLLSLTVFAFSPASSPHCAKRNVLANCRKFLPYVDVANKIKI